MKTTMMIIIIIVFENKKETNSCLNKKLNWSRKVLEWEQISIEKK